MKRVSQVLQLPVVVKRSWPPVFEPQPLQKSDFLTRGISAERDILEEFLQAWFCVEGRARFPLDELKSLQVSKRQSAAQDNFHSKRLEVYVPGFDQWIQKGYAAFNRYLKDVRIQELENGDTHTFVASIAQPCHQVEPVLTF